jgi:hypothetical protein
VSDEPTDPLGFATMKLVPFIICMRRTLFTNANATKMTRRLTIPNDEIDYDVKIAKQRKIYIKFLSKYVEET